MTTPQSARPATAYRAFREALVAAPAYADPRLTAAANGEERAKLIRSARSALAAATPPVPERTVTRQTVLAARAPRTADDVALQARERDKVRELRNAGQSFTQIIGAASERRVAALIDAVEGIAATDPAQAQELEELLFDRLADLGASDAIAAREEDRTTAAAAAWNGVLTEALAGEVSMAARTAAYVADEEGYAEAFAATDQPVDWSAISRIELAHPEGDQ